MDLLRERIGRAGAAGPDLLAGLGGFAAALQLPGGYDAPVLVSATDGVGTKTEIARRLGRLDTIGRDLVAMCADDVACHGARPLFFLDYVAVGRLDPERVSELVGGVADGCREAGCALVGGETAEHPGLMPDDAFDLAGFCVGIVERRNLLDGSTARAGDAVIGIASSGLHANGYSLVRAVIDRHGLDLAGPWADVLGRFLPESARAQSTVEPWPADATLGDVLLAPTRIYAPDVLALRDELTSRGLRLSGVAHVTGGGLPGNLPRAVGRGLGVRVDPASWPEPALFDVFGELGGLSGPELRATFNCGIGMGLVVDQDAVEAALGWLAERGLRGWMIGRVVPAEETGAARYAEGTW